MLAGREYLMDIVLSKNGVKCAEFKISDVQKVLPLYLDLMVKAFPWLCYIPGNFHNFTYELI